MFNLFDDNGAVFKSAELHGTRHVYRYQLWRRWDKALPSVCFVGLNPSTANEFQDDQTIRRVTRFAKSWGFGGVYMVNLFAFVSTDPLALLHDMPNKIGPENDKYLQDAAGRCSRIIFAWGAFDVHGRDKEVIAMFPEAEALLINSDGSPRHPLYVSGKVIPVKYKT